MTRIEKINNKNKSNNNMAELDFSYFQYNLFSAKMCDKMMV